MFAHGGMVSLWLFTILVILEVTFSFDNAVINSRILVRMSPFWQKLFLTVGIFIAVFVVRFLVPIVIVMLTSGHGFSDVIGLALHNPVEYGETLHKAAPTIDAFGGTFLVMLGISYFMDRKKDIHWLGAIEAYLARAGNYETLKVFVMLLAAMALYFTVDTAHQTTVLVASILGTLLHLGLEDKLDMPVGLLSGGQRQALALLLSTLTPVDLLILDEHTAALDPKSSENVMELTEKFVREKQLTAIMVTHNLRYAVAYGDRLVMMHQGQVVKDAAGADKEACKVDDLLKIFNEISIECGN